MYSKDSYKPDLTREEAVVEVKTSVTAARGLRDSLVALAIFLLENCDKRGYLLLLNPKLSNDFLNAEFHRFRSVLRKDVAGRLHLVLAKGDEIIDGFSHIPPEDKGILYHGLAMEKDSRTTLPNASKQDEVFLVMLHQWITGKGPMTSKWLQKTVGCNYRTVAGAIERLGHAVRRFSDRSVSLKYFPELEWERILATSDEIRRTMLYADASDQPRSPESLMNRLRKMQLTNVAVGGVLGVKHYYKDLDIVGTPRLDLSIHCIGKQVDLDFVHRLDPALEQTRDTHRPSQLALHFIRRKEAFFDRDRGGSLWADPVECLLELYNARLDNQARSFQDFLATRGKELNG